VVVRPPLVYGPGVGGNFLRLMKLVHSRIPIPFGKIYNRRTYVGLGNLVDFLLLCAMHPSAPGNTFLVGDDRQISLVEMMELLGVLMGRKPCVYSLPPKFLRFWGLRSASQMNWRS